MLFLQQQQKGAFLRTFWACICTNNKTGMVPSASSLQKTIGVTRTECLASTGLTDVAWSKRKGLTSILRIGEINAQKGSFFCLCYLNLRSKKMPWFLLLFLEKLLFLPHYILLKCKLKTKPSLS